MPRTRVVVQSRLSSSRLPGKALLPVGGLPLVALVARRAARDRFEVVVATSTAPEDDVLARAVEGAGVPVLRGSLDDVLGRFVVAVADLSTDDVIVRMTGDNPVPDADLVAELLEALTVSGRPYARIDVAAVPYGLGAEAITVGALRRAGHEATDAYDREHVTPWLRRTFGDVLVVPAKLPPNAARLRCTVDVLDDYVAVAELFAGCTDPVAVPWAELVDELARRAAPGPSLPVRDTSPLGQSVLVLGGAQFGLDYGVTNLSGRPGDEAVRAILRAAVAGGVTHVDTARGYGESEATLRRCVEPALAQRLRVVTKVAPLSGIGAGADPLTARLAVEASVERSFAELGRRQADAVLLHRLEDAAGGGGAVWARLRDYLATGEVGRIGVSVQSPAELATALDLDALGYIQLPFNVVDRRWLGGEVLAGLGARPDVVVAVRSVYLQGVLAAGGPVRSAVPADVEGLRTLLAGLVRELRRESVADLCLAYVLGHPWVTSVVVGAETARDVTENVALASRPPLTLAECVRVRAVVPAGSAELVDPSRWGRHDTG